MLSAYLTTHVLALLPWWIQAQNWFLVFIFQWFPWVRTKNIAKRIYLSYISIPFIWLSMSSQNLGQISLHFSCFFVDLLDTCARCNMSGDVVDSMFWCGFGLTSRIVWDAHHHNATTFNTTFRLPNMPREWHVILGKWNMVLTSWAGCLWGFDKRYSRD